MAKARTAYVCSECGADFNKWQGQCSACGAWDTIAEIVLESAAAAKSPASRRSGWAGKIDAPKVMALKDVQQGEDVRVSTGIGEFDRVLGGGLVEGAVVLVGGDPGIGKSTLLLQALAKMAAASTDDVAAAAGRASAKAAGVVVDDTAVAPRYVQGVSPARELPIIWKIARGSLFNKIVILLPAALLDRVTLTRGEAVRFPASITAGDETVTVFDPGFPIHWHLDD